MGRTQTHGTGGTYRVRNLWIRIRGQPAPEVSGQKIKAPTYIRMKLEKITLKYAQIFIFIFVTFFA